MNHSSIPGKGGKKYFLLQSVQTGLGSPNLPFSRYRGLFPGKQPYYGMLLIEFTMQSIMHSKHLTKAKIGSSERGGGGTLQAKSHMLKRLNSSSARSNVRISNLLKTHFFVYCLFYNVTVNTLKYISCLLKIRTVLLFISPDF
jgi:hypothetical protein